MSALQACKRQHAVYAPTAIFYGTAPLNTKWYVRVCRWSSGIGIILPTNVTMKCTNTALKPDGPWGCALPPQDDCDKNKQGTPTGSTPNPIDLVSGTKRFRAVDFETADGALRLVRSYSSLPWAGTPSKLASVPQGLANWQFDFQVELQIGEGWEASKTVAIALPNGTAVSFARQTNGTMATYTPAAYPRPQTDYTLTFNGTWPSDLNTIRNAKTYWTLRDAQDNVWSLETFADAATGLFTIARPTQVVYRSGLALTLAYGSSYQLTSVTDSYGKQITFTWEMIDPALVGGTGAAIPGAIKEALLPGGYKLKYTYETIGTNTTGLPQPDRLSKVEFVDSASTVLDSTTYQYNDANVPNAVTTVLDKNNVVRWNVTYDAEGRATVSEGPSSADRAMVAYTPNGTTFTRTVTNALGKVAIYNYSSNAPNYNVKLTSVAGQASTNCPASAGTFAYTSNLVSSRTDEEGRVTTYTRNAKAQVTQMVEASGTPLARTTTNTWHATLNLPTQTVKPGLTTAFTYDTQGRILTRTETDTTSHTVPYSTNGQTRTWTYTWSTTGQLLTMDGPLAGVTDKTTYTYSPNGYLATVTNGLGHLTTINTVNSRGQPTQVTDPNSVVTNLVYDGLGRLTSATVNPGASQAVTSFQYNVVGQVTQVTLPNSVVLTFAYNDAKRLTSITNAAGEKLEYIYNAMGNITEVDTKNASAVIVQQVRYTFDELGRTLKLIGAVNQETRYAYDKIDNNTQVTDPRSKVYGNTFDELNRLKRETDPNLFQTNKTFTGRDDVATVADARTNTTSYVRNGWGDIIRETSPDRGIMDHVYDSRGLMTQRTDARGQVTNFAYDGLGRMTSRSFPGASAETITWTYDSVASGNKGKGRLTGVTDPSGTVAYTWNELGQMTRIVRVIGARTYQTDYGYDLAGNLTQITMPSGRIVTYTRDSLARVTAVATKDNAAAASNTVVSSATWRPFGPLASMTFGNSLALTLGYDNDGRLTGINATGAGATVQNLTYGYDLASNITSIGDALASNRNQTFGYDNLNRLTSATGLYGTNTYSYDAVGNRTQKTVTVPFGSTDTYTTPATSNRLSSISGGTARTLTYTASGQASADQRTAVDAWTYTTDKAGRMSEAKLNTVSQATFAYDGDELRVRKTITSTGAITHYLYDAQGQLIAEMDGATGAVIREYIWLGALPIGYVDRLGSGGASRLFFVHADHLARPQKITDTTRAVVWDGVFAPFGEIHAITGSIVNVLMFPGQVYDPETGLSQNWHRDYDANIGRYLQSDPIGLEGGINTYAYVGGNPVIQVDPSGESSKGIKWGGNKRYRECNQKEMEACEKQCDPDPVESCKRAQTFSIERVKPLPTYSWKDQGLSCSCKRREKSYCEKNPATCAGMILGVIGLGLCVIPDRAAHPIVEY
ncbi:MAG: RHS repeat protein [Alphaproteobacteria bacterium]|nr:RHS repeat protein [Alphaproteobacteria bacterium]